MRAALIGLFHRTTSVELLILDEPMVGLDFVGLTAIRDTLRSWTGAVLIVSYDRDFLDTIGICREVKLENAGQPKPRSDSSNATYFPREESRPQ